MVLAAFRDGLYNVVLLLHIVAVLVAFAPAVIHPMAVARVKQASGEEALPPLARWMAANTKAVHVPALVAIGVFGALMVLLSDDLFGFDQLWVWLALVLWLAVCGIITGGILPAEAKLAGGDLTAEKRIAAAGPAATLLAVAILYLMIWKPGL